MKAIQLPCNGILTVLLAATFPGCTYAQPQENTWTSPLHIPNQKVDAFTSTHCQLSILRTVYRESLDIG